MPEMQTWEAPRIEPLTFTSVGKHLAADVLPGKGFADIPDIGGLLAEYGSPLFVVSESALRGLIRSFQATFQADGIDTQIAYSYKTNYLPAICSIMHEEGAWAEIVSGMEYKLARALGTPGENIVFNGPHKTREELETAFGEGALVNVDNFDELSLIEQIAAGIDRPCRLGIRVNFDFGPQPWTKFGFNYDNGDCRAVLERLARNPALGLEVLHNHSGTFQLVHEIYGRAAEVLIDVGREARSLGLEPTGIDLGGGFPSANRLKPEYDLPGSDTRAVGMLEPYAAAILSRLDKARDVFGGHPTLILEPGRAVVDSAVQLLCTVIAAKDIPDRGRALIVDAGVNLVPTACWYDHKVDTAEEEGGEWSGLEAVKVFGPLCMQIDVLRERAMLPHLVAGDPLVISNVGAYCQTQSMQFIQTRPATVLLGPDGPEVIRQRESWREVFALDHLPDRLRTDGAVF